MTTSSLSLSIALYAIRVRGMAWGGGLEQGWDARSQRVQPSDDNDIVVWPARARANNRAGAKGPVRTRAGAHRPARVREKQAGREQRDWCERERMCAVERGSVRVAAPPHSERARATAKPAQVGGSSGVRSSSKVGSCSSRSKVGSRSSRSDNGGSGIGSTRRQWQQLHPSTHTTLCTPSPAPQPPFIYYYFTFT
jgi:hypothetical protein